jgi:hypothetical protein
VISFNYISEKYCIIKTIGPCKLLSKVQEGNSGI